MRIRRIAFRVLQVILFLVLALVVTSVIVILIDNHRTAYLDIENNSQAETNTYVIINASVIPMTSDTVMYNKAVLIEQGIIRAIADSIDTFGKQVVDANGRYLSPGLTDMHVHVWDEYELGLYLSYGVTTVRNLWGRPEHLRIRTRVDNDEILSPLFLTSSPKLTGPDYVTPDNVQLRSADEARQKVISYRDRGYDFIKTYYGLTRELFDAIISQAEILEMDIAAHPTPEVPYSYHFNPQIVSIEHAEDIVQQPLNYKLDTIKLKEVMEKFSVATHSSFSPTLIVYYNIYNLLTDNDILSSGQLSYINPMIRMFDSKAQFDRWQNTKAQDSLVTGRILDQHEFHKTIIKKMHERGVNIVCSTDAGIGITAPGVSIHQELALYSEAGLSNFEVLKTATANTSHVHQSLSSTGTIEEGNMANLLLLENNPLDDLRALKKPDVVFIKGRKLDRALLDNFERRALDRKNMLATLLRHLEYFAVEKW